MHTTKTDLGTAYHHNGDYSGNVMFNVRIARDAATWQRQDEMPMTDGAHGTAYDYDDTGARLPESEHQVLTVTVPFADMLHLAMDKLRSEATGKLEMATTEELIALLAPLGRI